MTIAIDDMTITLIDIIRQLITGSKLRSLMQWWIHDFPDAWGGGNTNPKDRVPAHYLVKVFPKLHETALGWGPVARHGSTRDLTEQFQVHIDTERFPKRSVLNKCFFFVFLFFLKIFCLDQGPFCGATDCSCFGLRVSFLMGFKSRVDILPALFLACML